MIARGAHPTLGSVCFGKNVNALTDIYCQDCESRGICEESAVEHVREVLRELRECADLRNEAILEKVAR